jgi:hypothetical protein
VIKVKPPNETVEKPFGRKTFVKISHWTLKNGDKSHENGTLSTKIWRFLMILSHFQVLRFEKGLFRQFQRLVLAPGGGFGGKMPKGESAFGAASPRAGSEAPARPPANNVSPLLLSRLLFEHKRLKMYRIIWLKNYTIKYQNIKNLRYFLF